MQNKALVDTLIFDETFTVVPAEYSNYNDVFSMENAAELSENIGINENAIKLKIGKQLLFRPIYSLGPVELKMLKTYIETNLANGFICPSKSPIRAPILFDRKPNGSLRLCVDYWDFNNLTVNNQYPLSFIRESLNQLG